MAQTVDVVSALRELTSAKQLERSELVDLLKDGLHAALVKRYGPNVRPEISVDELKGTIRIAPSRLRLLGRSALGSPGREWSSQAKEAA